MVDQNGHLPLHNACSRSGDSVDMLYTFDIIRFLVEQYRAGIRVRGKDGCLPLHCAVSKPEVKIVQFLIDSYPDAVHVADDDGMLPLHHACIKKFSSIDRERIVELLIREYKGDSSNHSGISVEDTRGLTPLHHIAMCE